jgi:hypothetical protein
MLGFNGWMLCLAVAVAVAVAVAGALDLIVDGMLRFAMLAQDVIV